MIALIAVAIAENRPMLAPQGPRIKACCLMVANLVRTEHREPFTTDTCQVCGCRHRRLWIDNLAEVLRR